ncbi:MAG: tetratricopeptide repeat protein [Anaerolineaceae bacterium]|nr:tetratricopeptide repeat protein [Anaerolineaceae bacterium]
MQSYQEWLDALRSHKEDERWLDAHGDDIQAIIRTCLSVPHKFEIGTELLIMAFPYYALYRATNTSTWIGLLIDGLLQAQEREDEEIETQLMSYVAEGRMAQGNLETAYIAYTYVIEQAHAKANMSLELEGHTGLIWLQAIHQNKTSSLNNDLIENALNLARLLGNSETTARLYHALAAVYIQYRYSDKALEYGQMAYAYWLNRNERIGQAKVAYSLASAYRMIDRLELADSFLAIAMDVFSKTNYQRQYILTVYERGVLFWKRGLFEEAEQWLNEALVEAQKLGVNFHIASVNQALGQVYIDLDRLQDARERLKAAQVSWKDINNIYQQASVCCILACLENKAGDPDAAGECIALARSLCSQIIEDNLREKMEKFIENAESGIC